MVLWADTFEKLMGARICVAVTHSIFWSIMTPLAARVAPFGKQAFGLAAVMGGSIVATVLGVPIGTHLGQQVGWQGSLLHCGYGCRIGLGYYLLLAACLYQQPGRFFKEPAVLV